MRERAYGAACAGGDALTLVREAENKYDKRAVAVYWHRRKLGYVPRVENAAVAQMLDRGDHLAARIVRLEHSSNPWDRIHIEVSLDG
ncbi:MAG: HIRAN domain-containing protein [Mariprofundaceae bacterium]